MNDVRHIAPVEEQPVNQGSENDAVERPEGLLAESDGYRGDGL